MRGQQNKLFVFFAIPQILRKAYLHSIALNCKASVAKVPIII
jgi:hypothetical protein